jgi:hypothetical protein
MALETTKDFSISDKCFNQVDYAKPLSSITDQIKRPLVEHSDQSYELGLRLKRLRDQFNITDRPLEIITGDSPQNKKYFEGLQPEYEYLLLKEFLFRDDFSDFLLRSMNGLPQRITFAKLLSPMNVYRLILNANSASEVSKIFSNMLLACRLLPPIAQKEIYDNLNALYTAATRIGRVYGQESIFESKESLLIALFEFDLLPLSYSSSAKTREDHFFAFIEALWDLFPTIISNEPFLYAVDRKFLKSYAEKIYESVTTPKYEGETWETIVSRIKKKSGWAQSIRQMYMNQEDLIPGESVASKEFHYFVFAVYGVFGCLVKLFEDHSDQAKKTQVLVNENILKSMPNSIDLEAIRKIRKVSVFKDKNLLLAAYNKLVSKATCHFRDDYCDDIINGLSEDPKAWIAVLKVYCFSRYPPKSRFAYDSFYGPVKRILASASWTENNDDYYASVAKVFSKMLEIKNSATIEDWILLLRSEFFRVHPDIFIDIIQEIGPVSLPEESRSDLVICLLSAAPLQPRTVLALIRLMETSKNPLELGRLILERFDAYTEISSTTKSNMSSCTWNFLAVVAKSARSTDVCEKLLRLLLRVLKSPLKSGIHLNAAAMCEVYSCILETNLSLRESCQPIVQSIESQIGKILKDTTPDTFECFYFASMLYKINPSNKILNINKASYELRSVLLIMQHRTTPAFITVNDFSEGLEQLLLLFGYNTGEALAHAGNSLMLIEFIQEFHSESYYFNVIRSSQFDSRIHEHRFEAFYPRLQLLEAKKYLNDNQPIPDSVKKFLSYGDDSYWYGRPRLSDDQSIERYLLLRNEQQYIAEEAAKIFSRTTDAYSVKFFAKLYFFILNHVAVTEIYAATVFTQLARF